jgi:hypothetical protein
MPNAAKALSALVNHARKRIVFEDLMRCFVFLHRDR